MYANAFWDMFGLIIAIICIYLLGRNNGIKKTKDEYEVKSIIKNQQQEIDFLNRKIEDMKYSN